MSKEVHVRIQNDGRDVDAACDADYHQHCACPATCKCPCHPRRESFREEHAEADAKVYNLLAARGLL